MTDMQKFERDPDGMRALERRDTTARQLGITLQLLEGVRNHLFRSDLSLVDEAREYLRKLDAASLDREEAI
jgi:hypothetical protein